MIIIGITGTIGAGKNTAVDYLVSKYGFTHYSARDFITEEVTKRGLPISRNSMTEVANELTAKNGPAFVIGKLYEQAFNSGKDTIIESIRRVGEINLLRGMGHFYLLAVDADPRIRYERIHKRGSVTDHISFEKFLQDEQREMASSDPNKQNISACIERADYAFNNNDGLEFLEKQIDEMMQKLAEEKGL